MTLPVAELPALPAALAVACGAKVARDRSALPPIPIDVSPDLAEHVRGLVRQYHPTAPQGTRNDTAFKVACVVRDYVGANFAAVVAITAEWNAEIATPPLDDLEIERVCANAIASAQSRAGAKGAERAMWHAIANKGKNK